VVVPGSFLAEPAGLYAAPVRSVKTCGSTTFVVLDGGMNHHLAASGKLGQVLRRGYPIVNLSCRDSADQSTVEELSVNLVVAEPRRDVGSQAIH
jgi:diaminopimelate decarboxylase